MSQPALSTCSANGDTAIGNTDSEAIAAFWKATLECMAREPLNPVVEKLDQPLPYETFCVELAGLHGVRYRACLSRPHGLAPGRRLPAIITAPGYGGFEQGITAGECQRGYVVLQIYPRGQGESAEALRLNGCEKLAFNIQRPEGYYYQGAYCDMVRGLDYLASRHDVDAERIGAMGTSQGGALALAAAALDTRIRAVTAHLPFLCAAQLCAGIPGSGIRVMLENAKVDIQQALPTLSFFDVASLARRVTAPVLLSSGGLDTVCPAASIGQLFDSLPGIKSLVHYPGLEHTSSSDFYDAGWHWMDRHLRRC